MRRLGLHWDTPRRLPKNAALTARGSFSSHAPSTSYGPEVQNAEVTGTFAIAPGASLSGSTKVVPP
jgi:hypothetical protein